MYRYVVLLRSNSYESGCYISFTPYIEGSYLQGNGRFAWRFTISAAVLWYAAGDLV